MAMRNYQAAIPELQKDPYFAGSKCFKKTVQTLQAGKYDLSSMSSSFWAARHGDETYQTPALSSVLGIDYFSTGNLQPQMAKSLPLACGQIDMSVDSLVRQLSKLGLIVTSSSISDYENQIQDYNDSVKKLNDMVQSQDPAQVVNLQNTVRQKANLVMSAERKLVDMAFKKFDSKNDPCSRRSP